MPIYEYRCNQGHTFEVTRRMTDEPLAECLTCAAPVEQIFHPITIHFKGSGFYNTDYGTQKRSREQQEKNNEAAKAEAKPADAKSAEAAPPAGDAKPEKKVPEAKSAADAKPEKKASTPAPKKSSD